MVEFIGGPFDGYTQPHAAVKTARLPVNPMLVRIFGGEPSVYNQTLTSVAVYQRSPLNPNRFIHLGSFAVTDGDQEEFANNRTNKIQRLKKP